MAIEKYHKTVLKNGIRIVSEDHPDSRAVSIGIWIETGTRDERADQVGISHFLEHLVFKGTKTRTAYDIAKSLEIFGGELNAFTTKEYTCFHALVLSERWREAVDVLCDLICNMSISSHDFRLEKGVVLQEIAMADENYEEVIFDIFFEEVYKKNSLSRPILGSPSSLYKLKMKDVRQFYMDHYLGKNLIVSASGRLDHTNLVGEIETRLNRKSSKKLKNKRTCPKWNQGFKEIDKATEQFHLLLGFPVSSFRDELRFEAYILNALLGGGMTSRLYQGVREKKGLVYAIHSQLSTFTDCGLLQIYAQTELKNVDSVIEVIARELKKIRKKGVKKSDIEMFKAQTIGSILLGSDDIENRMTSLAVNEMVFGRYRSVDNVVEEIEKVNFNSVHDFIDKYFKTEMLSGVLLGSGASSVGDWWKKLGD